MANKTFEIELWQYLRNAKTSLDKKIYFGLAPTDVAIPYCVMHVLDMREEENAQTLCRKDIVKLSNIQFSVYATNDMVLNEILNELNEVIKGVELLDDYRITINKCERTKTASIFSNEVGMGLTEFYFNYENA